MNLLIPYTISLSPSPRRVVHLAKSLQHVGILQNKIGIIALPSNIIWKQLLYEELNMERLCARMGKPNPLWSMEIVHLTPITRLLIEDRLIEFHSSAGSIPSIEKVDLIHY